MKEYHKDHVIQLNQDHWFTVEGEHFPRNSGGCAFRSYSEAIQAIDMAIVAKAQSEKPTVNLKVLSQDGSQQLTVKGIHAGRSKLLFVEKVDIETIDEVFPVNDIVKAMLTRRADLKRDFVKLDAVLRKLRIKSQRGYGKIGNPEKLNEYLRALVQEHGDVTRMAEKLEAEAGPAANVLLPQT